MDNDRTDIFLIGDSTMCFYTTDRAPRTGWGMALPQFCKDNVRVHNFAQSGYSTKMFQKSGWLDHTFGLLRRGDHVIIQFGHNDKHPIDLRPRAHTEIPEFAGNLASWIATIRELGAIPTLCTTTIEWAPDGLSDRTKLLTPYNKATIEVAAECDVDIIDLNTAAYNKLTQLTMPEIHQFHMATSGVEGSENDYCHLKENGADLYAGLFVDLCRKQNSKISTCFK